MGMKLLCRRMGAAVFVFCRGGVVLRFIHTADWHLGRLFHGRHLTDDQAFLLLGDFLRIVKESKAEAVVIAGDIYDRAVPPTDAVDLFDEVLARLLLDYRIPVLFIAGNHDSGKRLGFGSRLMARQGLFVRGELEDKLSPVVLEDAFGPVYFELFPYMEPALVRAVFGAPAAELMDFDAATGYVLEQGAGHIPAGARSVAVSHAFIAGGQVTDSERPLSVGGSSNVRAAYYRPFNYTALGHLHNAQRAGADNIRYSGSLMKYSFDEAAQKKSLAIVDLDAEGAVTTELVPLVPRYDVCCVRGLFDDILQDRERYPASDDYMMVELEDTSAILDAHGRLEKIYPNLMQIERLNLNRGGTLLEHGSSYRSQSEQQLFEGFFCEMTGESMTDEEKQVFADNAAAIFRAQREAEL